MSFQGLKDNKGQRGTTECEFCSYVGSTKYDLKRHIDIGYVRIRNNICEICGYATFLKPYLETHMKIHIKWKIHALMFLYLK